MGPDVCMCTHSDFRQYEKSIPGIATILKGPKIRMRTLFMYASLFQVLDELMRQQELFSDPTLKQCFVLLLLLCHELSYPQNLLYVNHRLYNITLIRCDHSNSSRVSGGNASQVCRLAILLIDFSKAFDPINHKYIQNVLAMYG